MRPLAGGEYLTVTIPSSPRESARGQVTENSPVVALSVAMCGDGDGDGDGEGDDDGDGDGDGDGEGVSDGDGEGDDNGECVADGSGLTVGVTVGVGRLSVGPDFAGVETCTAGDSSQTKHCLCL
jgi:hypothetical protein